MDSPKISPIAVAGFCVFFLLWGCAGRPGVSDLSAEQKVKLAAMPVFKSETLPAGSYESLGQVQTVCCKKSFDSAAELMQMKIAATRLGADAILNLSFREKDEMDWVRDCWATVIGTGDAVRITNTGAALK
jgi:hypothetical protein